MNDVPWRVHPPSTNDAAALAQLATAVAPQTALKQPATMKRIIQQANGRFWVIRHRQQPIGFATLLSLPGLPHILELEGGIATAFRRQGAGSFLWQQIQQDVAAKGNYQITHLVSSLDSPAAHFLAKHGFTLGHEEWTMELADLPAAILPLPALNLCQFQRVDLKTAVRTLPTLYHRAFAHTPWFQPYSSGEVTTTWQPDDRLYYLTEGRSAIGFVWLHFSEENIAEIEPIGIVAEKQGKGYGRTLLTTILIQLQTEGIQTVTLGVWANNNAAVHLYQSLGFRKTSSRYAFVYNVPQT